MSAGGAVPVWFLVLLPSAPHTSAAPLPMVVAPVVMVPDLFPQLVSERESTVELPPMSRSPRTQSAQGGSRNRILAKVAVMRWCALVRPSLLASVGTQPTAATVRSLLWAPLATVTRKPPTWVAPTKTRTSTLPSQGAGT